MADTSDVQRESHLPTLVTLVALPLAIYLTYWQINAGDGFSLLPALEALLIAGAAGAVTGFLVRVARGFRTSFQREMARGRR